MPDVTMLSSLASSPKNALGQYRIGVSSGLITGAAIVAGAPLFSARWGSTTRLAVITRLSAYYVVTTAFTGVQELGLEAVLARGFTASDSGGTALTLTTNNAKMRTSQDTSSFTDIRIAAATLLTAGTRTLDTQAIEGFSGISHDPNAAAGTAQIVAQPWLGFDWMATPANGEHPIVLAQDEGVVVRNTIAFPAAGAVRLWVKMAWAEVSGY